MKVNDTFMDKSELKEGDILLCYKAKGFIARMIGKTTSSKYIHAAIFYGNSCVAESVALNGIRKGEIGKTNIQKFIKRYDHVAVLRQPDAWVIPNRVTVLKSFIDEVIDTKVKYNFLGILGFRKRKNFHISNIYNKLNAFFNGETTDYSAKKLNYFCSEFVCECFIKTGFIESSAAVLYQPDTLSPGDLGNDPTFGTFLGYLAYNKNYKVPKDDIFYKQNTVDEIFSS